MQINFMKSLVVLASFGFLVSCSCNTPLKVTSIQRTDKKLTCRDIILEINESEHYREHARSSRKISVGESLSPLCWVSGVVDGDKAAKAANSRIEYLGNIYDLLDCGSSDDADLPKLRKLPLKVQPGVRKAPPPPPPPPLQQKSFTPPPPPPPAPVALGKTISGKKLNFTTNKYYRRISADLHEHKDQAGREYRHSHSHARPHVHLSDQ